MNYLPAVEQVFRRFRWVMLTLVLLALPVDAITLLEQLQAEKAREASQEPMVWVEKGCFQMGQSEAEKKWLIEQSDQATYDQYFNDEKQHEVCLDKDFMMAKYEVTVGEFRAFVEATDYKTDAEKGAGGHEGCRVWNTKAAKWEWGKGLSWKKTGVKQTAKHPVVCVSWNDAMAYKEWLSGVSGKDYSLPTEVQWEFAARAGKTMFRYWGDDKKNEKACEFGNVADLVHARKFNYKEDYKTIFMCQDAFAETAPVGRYRSNGFGLYDMLGNVWEWTCSAYEEAYDGSEQHCVDDSDDRRRVLRGGSWSHLPWYVRSAFRSWNTATYRDGLVGFRLTRTP